MRRIAILLLFGGLAFGQGSLSLGTVPQYSSSTQFVLNLSGSGNSMVGIQWRIRYPNTVSISAKEGEAALSSGKYFHWVGNGIDLYTLATVPSGVYMLQNALLFSFGNRAIQDGVLAVFEVKFKAGIGGATVSLSNFLGVDASGKAVALNTKGTTLILRSPM